MFYSQKKYQSAAQGKYKPRLRSLFLVFAFVVVCVCSQILSSWITSAKNGTSKLPQTTPIVSFKSQAQKCDIIEEFGEWDLKSQSKEDEQLLSFFNGLCKGTYVEMGALNGKAFSNSWVFNKRFDWKGILVELVPENFEELKQNRQNEIALVHAAVCENKQTIHYVKGINLGATSGIYEFASEKFKKDWWSDIKLDSPEVREMECLPMKEILGEHHNEANYFDFFSLDVEGAELQVLKSIDYEKVGFGIILVEADGSDEAKDEAVISFLESKGYTHFSNYARSDWFFNDQFLSIYRDLWHSKPSFYLS